MSSYVFIERARMGKSFYQITDNHLKVSGSRFLVNFALEVDLRDISPRVERLSRRFYRPIVFGLTVGSLLAAITYVLVVQTLVPDGAMIFYAEFTGVFSAAFLGTGLMWIPRVEVVRFKNTLGATLFDAVKEKKYAAEFEEFVEFLRDRAAKSKELGK